MDGIFHGIASDYAYDKLGIKYSYTIELGSEEFGFLTPKKEIKAMGEEGYEGIMSMARALLDKSYW